MEASELLGMASGNFVAGAGTLRGRGRGRVVGSAAWEAAPVGRFQRRPIGGGCWILPGAICGLERSGIFTTGYGAIMGFRGATVGRRRSCRSSGTLSKATGKRGPHRRKRERKPYGGDDAAPRRLPRALARRLRAVSISSSRWMTQRTTSIPPSWSKRKGRFRRSVGLWRRFRRGAVLLALHGSGQPLFPYARSRRQGRSRASHVRSGARSRIWGSSPSRPIRLRPSTGSGAARSACSGPSRIGS